MATPHKHADLIKAWADGAEIEYWSIIGQKWLPPDTKTPLWSELSVYRIKSEPKPDTEIYISVQNSIKHIFESKSETYGKHYIISSVIIDSLTSKPSIINDNLKLIFDGETGELKGAVVIDGDKTNASHRRR